MLHQIVTKTGNFFLEGMNHLFETDISVRVYISTLSVVLSADNLKAKVSRSI